MNQRKYISVHDYLKGKIQQGKYHMGNFLPSENELCKRFSITRTTVRKALDELQKEGFIEKLHGKGSRVIERRKSLGLLSVKGFSEVVGGTVKTVFLQAPKIGVWDAEIGMIENETKKDESCIFFERLRFVGDEPVMHEKNWFTPHFLPGFTDLNFVDGSFFKTLSTKYFIEILGSDSELRAEFAGECDAELLKIKAGAPVLHISIVFHTSNPVLKIYSELYCNTQRYPIGNSYFM